MSAQQSELARARLVPGPEADRLATAVYDAFLSAVDSLDDEDWRRPTECVPWTVRDMVGHLVGAAHGHASLPVFVGQYAWAVRHKGEHGGSALDAMNERQIATYASLSTREIVTGLRDIAPRAVTGRARRARMLGRIPVTIDAAGSWYDGMPTRTTMADLCCTVLTRDVWAHRLDLARALGTSPAVDPEVDGRLVADLVADWASRHDHAFELVLTGPAGGAFRRGTTGEPVELDALDFVRVMAGRRPEGDVPDSPLLATKVLF
jgi:uncharacterized protein (TIGR03083 family)